ncbi:hypothetical protein [Actinophytocola sp. NPDC049390]|uniref:hypothetical protein n=1 Tax=Actinophytocola sp. NPDC049390 TaxID=3363894 RepID=UPI0037B67941
MSDQHAPPWVAAVLPEEIGRQRTASWPDFHPEDFCHRCGRRNPVWYVDAELWNKGTAERRATTGFDSVLCPSCFVEMYERKTGQQPLWRVDPCGLETA